MDNKEDREWVLENIESINADVKDIDELCCALEHSTIFAIDYIQTFGTRLIDLDYKYKNQQQELERYKNIVDKIRKYMLDIDWKMGWQYVDYLDKLVKEELKGE